MHVMESWEHKSEWNSSKGNFLPMPPKPSIHRAVSGEKSDVLCPIPIAHFTQDKHCGCRIVWGFFVFVF